MEGISEEHLRQLRYAFGTFDRDGSGEIDAEEYRSLLNSFGVFPSDLELVTMISEVDGDGDGLVSFEEFARSLVTKTEGEELETEAAELRRAFSLFDGDASGMLDAAEIMTALNKLGIDTTLEEAEYLVRDIDRDGDGEVSFDEFVQYIIDFRDDESE